MTDMFAEFAPSLTSPARAARAITPSDSVAIGDVPKALYVGTGGTLVLRGLDGGEDAAWKNVASGSYVLFRASHVLATGTTAADILGLY